MAKAYNPPPNWPAPPAGWRPGPGWQPEASWGAPPEGWQLWVRANRHPFRLSLAVGVTVFAALLALAAATGRLTAESSGRLFFLSIAPAVAVGFVARASRTPWRWWLYPVTVLGGTLALLLLTAVGAVNSSTP